jgi:phosphate transport system substrate-binding protein
MMKPFLLRKVCAWRLACAAVLSAVALGAFAQTQTLTQTPPDAAADPAPYVGVNTGIAPYVRIDKLSGIVKAAGSSTVAAMLKLVIDSFETVQPDVTFDVGGAGSGTALAGMLEAPTTMGLLSRPVTAAERERFRAKYGYEPTEVKIAVDAVGVFVFKNNPVKALSLADLRRAFGRGPDAADRWGAFEPTGDWRNQPLTRFGLQRGRGAYELFREVVLEGGEFASEVSVELVSTSVVQGVATQPGGIGYASVFFRTQRTRLLPIAHKGEIIEPTAENALSGKYPLARFLYVVVNKKPDAPLDALQRQFLLFVLSRDGQNAIARQGFFPLSADVVKTGSESISRAGN